jgi:hypothetical protein
MSGLSRSIYNEKRGTGGNESPVPPQEVAKEENQSSSTVVYAAERRLLIRKSLLKCLLNAM